MHDDFQNKLTESIKSLLDYCKENDWSGYDPYDGLNSRLFQGSPFSKSKIFRLVMIQGMKRLPFNIRPLLLIPKTQNPKALALFLKAFIKLKRLGLLEDDDLIELMIQNLVTLRSPANPTNPIDSTNLLAREISKNSEAYFTGPTNHYWCWGYSFPWQTRTIIVPRSAPNLVCTTFVADALLDAYEIENEARYLNMATSAAEYLLNELYWEEGDSVACFSYPLPSLKNKVHNANFLAAALLCKVYGYTGEEKFLGPAFKAARYSADMQHEDGSWDYGESLKQHWVDNFHTGYNLCALKTISHYLDTKEYESNIRRGFEFYRNHFFREDAAPKYFNNRTYPVDIHSVAQSIITLSTFRDLDENNIKLARSVYEWAMANMLDEQGYFYYQVTPYYKNRISYMRWSQAWMLYALSIIHEHL